MDINLPEKLLVEKYKRQNTDTVYVRVFLDKRLVRYKLRRKANVRATPHNLLACWLEKYKRQKLFLNY